MAALALSGQVLMGQAVMVKMSEAEKNLAWEAAEQQKAAAKALEVRPGGGAGGRRGVWAVVVRCTEGRGACNLLG